MFGGLLTIDDQMVEDYIEHGLELTGISPYEVIRKVANGDLTAYDLRVDIAEVIKKVRYGDKASG